MNNLGILTYYVQPGDTMWKLAQEFNTTVSAIAALNPGFDINSLTIGQTLFILPGAGYNATTPVFRETPVGYGNRREALSKTFRLLWEQHMYWTVLAIKALAFDSPDTDVVVARLLENPVHFANTLRLYYGDEIANHFAALLKDHLVIASELVKASKAGNNSAAAEAEKRWYANADEIAAFLARINPHWSYNEWKKLLFSHLGYVKQIAVDMLTKQYGAVVKDIEPYEKEGLMMADVMTEGILKQFGNRL